jgi:hypothetical protein
MNEEKLRDMMEYAIELGADKKMWDPWQWSRLPGGWRRDMGKRQVVLYFNPDFF